MTLETIMQKAGQKIRRTILPLATAGMMFTTSCVFNSCEREPEPEPEPPKPPVESIIITGRVKNTPHDAHIGAEVVARKPNNEIIEVAKANAQGQYSLKIEGKIDSFKIDFSHDDKHEKGDTTVSWGNHTINKILPVIPVTDSLQYNITAIDNANDNKITDASVTLYANPSSGNLGDSITSGLTNSEGVYKGKIEQTRWIYNNDTINKINTILTQAGKENYETLQLTDSLKNELNITARLQPTNGQPQTYEYLLSGTGTPNEAELKAWLNNEIIMTSTTSNGSHQTNLYEHTNTTLTLDSITITANNHHKIKETNFHMQPGTTTYNFELQETEQETHEYLLSGTGTPNEAELKAWLNNEIIMTSTTSNGEHQTNKFNYEEATLTLDSLVITANNHHKQKETNFHMQPGNTTYNFELQEIEQETYEYWLFGNATPNNTTITGWKNGEPIITATVQNSTYETNKIETENTTMTLDSLIKKADGHITQKEINYILTHGGQQHNFNLEEIPTQTKTLNFTFKPLQVTGDPQHPENQYEITFGNQTQTITIGMQNEINVNITANIIDGNDNVIIRNIPYEASPNTPIDNDVIMIAHQNRDAFERAFAANSMATNSKYSSDYRQPLEVELDQINNKHNLEFLSVKNYFVNGQDFTEDYLQQDTIFMNTIIPRQILGTKSSGWNMHWEPYNHDGTFIDKVQFIHQKLEKNTKDLMPPIVTDPWNYAINLTIQASYRRDGQPTMKYEILEFESFEDPKYIEIINREPAYRNTTRIDYNNSVTMATNGNTFLSGGVIATGNATSPPNNLPTMNTSEEGLEFTYVMANPTTPEANGASNSTYLLKYNNEGNVTTSEMGDVLILYKQQYPKAKQFYQPPPTN